MKKRILTISREFGSGGRSIGKAVAKEIGYAYYDNELVTKIAEESGFDVDFILKKGEESNFLSPFFYNFSLSTRKTHGQTSLEDQLFVTQFKIIKDLADEEPCVIVGRCSDYVLQDRRDCIHVHVHGNEEFRARRIVNVYGEWDEPAESRIQEKDKRRKAYYEYYTDRKWGEAKNYHICLDSSVLGIDRCVEILVDAMKADY